MKLKRALILAGGKGTRMQSLTGGMIPKPMMELCGKPILVHTIEKLCGGGIDDIAVSVGHMHEKIVDCLGDGSRFGVRIRYIIEERPLGTGGALYYLKQSLKEPLLVCPGDVIFNIALHRMMAFHCEKNALITLFAHPNTHPYDSDLLTVEADGRVIGIKPKNEKRTGYDTNLVNAGVLILEPEALQYFQAPCPVNIEHDFVRHFLPGGRVYAYKSPEYIKDAGTPERFQEVERDLKSGIVQRRNLDRKQKAVFLDRDGTLNVYKGFITRPQDLELVPTASEAIKIINQSGYLAIVVSNQPVVARGECTEAELRTIFNKLEALLGQGGAYIDGIYYCPHHPDCGFAGEVKALKIHCDCRKPNIGMLKKAAADFNLDLKGCVMIGDDIRDMQTAENASIPFVMISNDRNRSIRGICRADSLVEAVSRAFENFAQ